MIYYIGLYTDSENAENRHSYLSAVNKMNYIINALESLGFEQTVVSCCETNDKRGYSGTTKKLNENVMLKNFRTFGRKNIFTKVADLFFIKIQLIFYLLKNIKKDDVLLAYHSPYYCGTLKMIKMLKKCQLVLEVEEIYSDVSGAERLRKKELAVCNVADAFLFPTKMLSDAVNPTNKPYVLIHGTYNVEVDKEKIFNDDKIHLVYAGTFDPRKGGGAAAVAATFLLESRYHMHIIGFGTETDKQNLLKDIERVSASSKCTVTYDGCLSGEEYIRFIQSCDIGLSTQNPDAAFNSTSFPSKILSYMANGLRVVSIKIPAIETSAVGKYLYYYDTQTPEEIAKAVMSVNLSDNYNGKGIIAALHKGFLNDISLLLKDLKNDR